MDGGASKKERQARSSNRAFLLEGHAARNSLPMGEKFEIVVHAGAAWEPSVRATACDLILASKAVSNRAALEANLQNAIHLAAIHAEGHLIATATIKRPQHSYRQRVSDSSGIDVRGYEAEFGYVAVEEKWQKHHLASALADKLLDGFSIPVFATTGHPAMKKILPRKGFVEKGGNWIGGTKAEPISLSLFLRG